MKSFCKLCYIVTVYVPFRDASYCIRIYTVVDERIFIYLLATKLQCVIHKLYWFKYCIQHRRWNNMLGKRMTEGNRNKWGG